MEKNADEICDGLLSRCFTFNPKPLRLALGTIKLRDGVL